MTGSKSFSRPPVLMRAFDGRSMRAASLAGLSVVVRYARRYVRSLPLACGCLLLFVSCLFVCT
jgi:hypothetical protein